jgi:hypothetical protein
MADTTDLKSVALMGVWVRLPPRAPDFAVALLLASSGCAEGMSEVCALLLASSGCAGGVSDMQMDLDVMKGNV